MGHWPTRDYGDECTHGIPTLWSIGHTPRFVIATFSGIQKTIAWQEGDGEPGNGSYNLVQDDFAPCFWVGGTDKFQATWTIYGVGSLIELFSVDYGTSVFSNSYPINAVTSFDNFLPTPTTPAFGFGSGVITW